MGKYISLGLARGRIVVLAYTPLIVAGVSAARCAIHSNEHQADFSQWRTSARKAMRGRNPESTPTHDLMLYRMIFLTPDVLAVAAGAFGSVAAQLPRVARVMNISITSSASVVCYMGAWRASLAPREIALGAN